MTPQGHRILNHLQTVNEQRALRAADPLLRSRVDSLKSYQQERFRRGYADLLEDSRYGPAARFFLEELYGPEDFSARDAQFARIVPALVRLFPEDIVRTVDTLAALHALSEDLDTHMARHLSSNEIRATDYVRAWHATGRPEDRAQQIALTLQVGQALDRFTRNPVLRHSLRVMRGPAKAAGLAALQAFLERGFDTFRAMRGAEAFLEEVKRREEALMHRLFEPEAVAIATTAPEIRCAPADPLVQLP